jgi:hypothetical protein
MGGHQSIVLQTTKCKGSIHDVAALMKVDGFDYMTSGFRDEFNGFPVFKRTNGTAPPPYDQPYAGTYNHNEYAIIERNQEGFVCLYDYRGPAGGHWTGDARARLITSFERAVKAAPAPAVKDAAKDASRPSISA